MSSPDIRRQKIKDVYLSPNWHERVDKMNDAQVAAIYQRMLDQKKIK